MILQGLEDGLLLRGLGVRPRIFCRLLGRLPAQSVILASGRPSGRLYLHTLRNRAITAITQRILAEVTLLSRALRRIIIRTLRCDQVIFSARRLK